MRSNLILCLGLGLLALGSNAAAGYTHHGKRNTVVIGGNETLELWSFNGDSFEIKYTYEASDPDTLFYPTWQIRKGNVLYSVDGRGNHTYAFEIDDRAPSLSLINKVPSLGANGIEQTADGKNLVSSSFAGSGVDIFAIDSRDGSVVRSQSIVYSGPHGPNPTRQKLPTPHQVVRDPQGKYLLVPDLGSDYLRIFEVSEGELVSKKNISVPPGKGPRHAAFWPPKASPASHAYVINELSNDITVYEVGYSPESLELKPTQTISTFGDRPVPDVSPTPSAAEIAISPDGLWLYASNRGDAPFINETGCDSIAQYAINQDDGSLTFIRHTPAGGVYPRHFSIDSTGRWALFANTGGNYSAAIYQRDIKTGKLADFATATKKVTGGAFFAKFLHDL